MKITIEEVEKIPEQNWIDFLKKEYDLDCGGADGFIIGEDEDEPFLNFDTFCENLNQTEVDVTEEQYIKIKNGDYGVDQDCPHCEDGKLKQVERFTNPYTICDKCYATRLQGKLGWVRPMREVMFLSKQTNEPVFKNE